MVKIESTLENDIKKESDMLLNEAVKMSPVTATPLLQLKKRIEFINNEPMFKKLLENPE